MHAIRLLNSTLFNHHRYQLPLRLHPSNPRLPLRVHPSNPQSCSSSTSSHFACIPATLSSCNAIDGYHCAWKPTTLRSCSSSASSHYVCIPATLRSHNSRNGRHYACIPATLRSYSSSASSHILCIQKLLVFWKVVLYFSIIRSWIPRKEKTESIWNINHNFAREIYLITIGDWTGCWFCISLSNSCYSPVNWVLISTVSPINWYLSIFSSTVCQILHWYCWEK